MSRYKLRIASKEGKIAGFLLFTIGAVLFIFFGTGDRLEKIGIFLMTTGAMMIGMSYAARVALDTT